MGLFIGVHIARKLSGECTKNLSSLSSSTSFTSNAAMLSNQKKKKKKKKKSEGIGYSFFVIGNVGQ
jgi:hypothetical protein